MEFKKKSFIFCFFLLFFQSIVNQVVLSSATFFAGFNEKLFNLKAYSLSFFALASFISIISWKLGNFAEKGSYRLFLLGLGSSLIGIFFIGNAIIAMSVPFVNHIFYFIATLFCGVGTAIVFACITAFIFKLFPKYSLPIMVFVFIGPSLGNLVTPTIYQYVLNLEKFILLMVVLGLCYFCLFIFADFTRNKEIKNETEKKIPSSVSLFSVALFIVGFLESSGANWIKINDLNVKLGKAEINLMYVTFWSIAIVGRIILGLVFLKYSSRKFYIYLPLLLAFAVLIRLFTAKKTDLLLLSTLALIPSCLLPMILVYAQKVFIDFNLKVTGKLFAGLWFGLGFGILFFVNMDRLFEINLTAFLLIVLSASTTLFFLNILTHKKFGN